MAERRRASTTTTPTESGKAWGEQMDVPFGGVQRSVFTSRSDHPLAPKMSKLYHSIVHDPKADNRNVRRSNVKAVAGLMEGVRAGMSPVAFNLAELFYNGAPGVPKDWNRTLELYVVTMEAGDDCAQASQEAWRTMFFNNMLGVVDSMEIDGMEPVASRLQAACALPCWKDLPETKLLALFSSARYSYLRSRRV